MISIERLRFTVSVTARRVRWVVESCWARARVAVASSSRMADAMCGTRDVRECSTVSTTSWISRSLRPSFFWNFSRAFVITRSQCSCHAFSSRLKDIRVSAPRGVSPIAPCLPPGVVPDSCEFVLVRSAKSSSPFLLKEDIAGMSGSMITPPPPSALPLACSASWSARSETCCRRLALSASRSLTNPCSSSIVSFASKIWWVRVSISSVFFEISDSSFLIAFLASVVSFEALSVNLASSRARFAASPGRFSPFSFRTITSFMTRISLRN
mmetsp:Transcript_48464/g.114349  ORF Transcript_48464/g.114349 Transcript_48464/m.114349 type:complete len:269 (-) Transcript_48464:182-988(-)